MGGAGVDTGCPPYCSAHACLQDKAEFKDKLSPVALSVALTLPKEPPGLVLYGHTLVQAQVGGTWLWGDVTMVTPGGLIPTAGPGHMWVPPAWVCSALGSPVCASVPNTPWDIAPVPPHHCPHFPLECAPTLSLPLPGMSILFCPLLAPQSPVSSLDVLSVPSTVPIPKCRNVPLFPLPSPIPPQDVPHCPCSLLGMSQCMSPDRAPGCPLCCPHSSLSEMSPPSPPSPVSRCLLECPLSTLHCPKPFLWNVPSGPSTSPISPWDVPPVPPSVPNDSPSHTSPWMGESPCPLPVPLPDLHHPGGLWR